MTPDSDAAESSRISSDVQNPTDRILLGACVALWLVALGAIVAAIVALVGLGKPGPSPTNQAATPWLLYTVIGVSAAVIVAAIPLLIRARRTALHGGQRPSGGRPESAQNVFGPPLGTEGRQRAFGSASIRRQPTAPATSRVGFPVAAVQQVWLRCAVVLIGAVGAATAGVGIATYLMASNHDSASWAVYGVAGVILLAMPAAPWFFLRQLHELVS